MPEQKGTHARVAWSVLAVALGLPLCLMLSGAEMPVASFMAMGLLYVALRAVWRW